MIDTMFWLVLLGSSIVVGLAGYAGFLLLKLYQQHRRHQGFLAVAQDRQLQQITERNNTIMESVWTIAHAGLKDQCDMSEAAIRLYKLMTVLQGEMSVNFAAQYPAMYELYTVVGEMPRGEERRNVPKQQRMKYDMLRMQAESRLVDDIKKELDFIVGTFVATKVE